MSKPLSNSQKFYLSKDAKRAWMACGKPGANENDWRREQVQIACGKPGLSKASNDDYLKIRAHFEALEGQTGKAFETSLRQQSEARRQQMHNLAEAVQKAGVTAAYAEEIAKDRFGKSLSDLTPEQLLDVTKTIRARAQKKEGNHRGPSAPKRHDKKKPHADETAETRLPALDPDERINAELSALSHHAN